MDVVLVGSLGDIWVTGDVAKQVAEAMNKGTKFVTIKGSMYATNSIRGLLKPEAYKEMYSTKRVRWICKLGSTHNYDEPCRCTQALRGTAESAQIAKEATMTPEQKKAAHKRAEATRAWIKKNKNNLKNLNNKAEREEFIKNFNEAVDKSSENL